MCWNWAKYLVELGILEMPAESVSLVEEVADLLVRIRTKGKGNRTRKCQIRVVKSSISTKTNVYGDERKTCSL